ncbi:MAG TPA: septation protein IspZ [Azospirillaceae bacterium]|nr:septation protein IspZ [Azospirillaceae bacterium]
MDIRVWTYRRRFTLDGHAVEVRCDAGMRSLKARMIVDGVAAAEETNDIFADGGFRNLRLAYTLPDGRRLETEAGYHSWTSVGVKAWVDGVLAYESHPGRPIALPKGLDGMAARQSQPDQGMQRMKQNWPAISVDIALGLLFFIVAKLTDLPTAAIVGAGAGLALMVVQRFVKVDLLGGLALFGVVMLLISAGFSIAFQDDWAVKMRSTILGVLTASLFLADAALGGRYLGKRLMVYLPLGDIDPGRLAGGLGVVGLVMAGMNYLVATWLPTDVWLFYTTFGDFALAMVLFMGVTRFARRPDAPAA